MVTDNVTKNPAAQVAMQQPVRAVYATPSLRVYGTLATLTRNTACSVSKLDGGKGCGGTSKGKSCISWRWKAPTSRATPG